MYVYVLRGEGRGGMCVMHDNEGEGGTEGGSGDMLSQ